MKTKERELIDNILALTDEKPLTFFAQKDAKAGENELGPVLAFDKGDSFIDPREVGGSGLHR